MGKILVFSDLHANKRAVEDLLSAIENVDLTICCGDFLGYGKEIHFCTDFVLKNVDLVVQGDHERLAANSEPLDRQLQIVRESTLYTRSKLSSNERNFLSSLQTEISYNKMFVTHSIGDRYLRTAEDFIQLCDIAPKHVKYLFFGHTHEQVLFKHENKIVINPGSITKGRRGFKRGYAIIDDENVQFVNFGDIP